MALSPLAMSRCALSTGLDFGLYAGVTVKRIPSVVATSCRRSLVKGDPRSLCRVAGKP